MGGGMLGIIGESFGIGEMAWMGGSAVGDERLEVCSGAERSQEGERLRGLCRRARQTPTLFVVTGLSGTRNSSFEDRYEASYDA